MPFELIRYSSFGYTANQIKFWSKKFCSNFPLIHFILHKPFFRGFIYMATFDPIKLKFQPGWPRNFSCNWRLIYQKIP